MSFKDNLLAFLKKFLIIAPAVVTVASAVTAMTPNPEDDQIVAIIHKALDVIALNVGHNAQLPAAPVTPDSNGIDPQVEF